MIFSNSNLLCLYLRYALENLGATDVLLSLLQHVFHFMVLLLLLKQNCDLCFVVKDAGSKDIQAAL